MPRRKIVLDLETNGRNPEKHVATEVAWWDLQTGRRNSYFPAHYWPDVVSEAELPALRMTRYVDRIAGEPSDRYGDATAEFYNLLLGEWSETPNKYGSHYTDKATIVGANPRFDVGFLPKLFGTQLPRDYEPPEFEPYHYRLIDVENMAFTAFHLDDVPGLWDICEMLDLRDAVGDPARPDHTAPGDVTCAGLAYQRLRERARSQQLALTGAAA